MKYIVAILLLCICSACDEVKVNPPADWEAAPRDYICTEDQMGRVHKEAYWCNENTSYFSSYCYGTAIMRNCTNMENKP